MSQEGVGHDQANEFTLFALFGILCGFPRMFWFRRRRRWTPIYTTSRYDAHHVSLRSGRGTWRKELSMFTFTYSSCLYHISLTRMMCWNNNSSCHTLNWFPLSAMNWQIRSINTSTQHCYISLDVSFLTTYNFWGGLKRPFGFSKMPITHVGTDRPRQLQEIADTLAAAKRIVMVTGAGISTNCGIPVRLVLTHLTV